MDQGTNNHEVRETMLDYVLKLMKWRLFVLKLTLAGTLLAVLIALVIPKWYMTMATVRGGGSNLNMGSMLESSGLASSVGALTGLGLPQTGGDIDYLIAIINSRTVLDSVIGAFRLREHYGSETIEDTRELLLSDMEVVRDISAGLVSFGVYDKKPERAAALTNYLVHIVNEVYTGLNAQGARNNREHLEKRYNQMIVELAVLEDSLRSFQERYGVYDITAQTELGIQAAAMLKKEVLMKEIELGIKKRVMSDDTPDMTMIRMEIDQMNKEINEMIRGDEEKQKGSIFIPFAQTPRLGLQYYRLFRDVEIHSELLKVIVPLLEQARLQEQRETPTIIVLDSGSVPEKKTKPRRMLIVLAGFMISLVAGLSIAMMKEHLETIRTRDPGRYSKLTVLAETILADIPFRKRRNT